MSATEQQIQAPPVFMTGGAGEAGPADEGGDKGCACSSSPDRISPPVHELQLDEGALARAAALAAPVQAACRVYAAQHPEAPPIVADVGYVLSGAIRVGLNYLLSAPSLLATCSGDDVSTVAVSVAAEDLATAEALVATLGGAHALDEVLGCACSAGLAMLGGSLVGLTILTPQSLV